MTTAKGSLQSILFNHSYLIILVGLSALGALSFVGQAINQQTNTVEWHDIVVEVFIGTVMTSWVVISRRINSDSNTFLYFFSGCTFIIWLMAIKFYAEWLIEPLVILTTLELLFSLLGLTLISMGLASWSNDYQSLIDQLDSNITRYKILSNTDAITGLNDRIQFESSVSHLIEQKREFSLLLIDLDKFKRIADTFGDAMSDTVLEHTARLVRRQIRELDYAFRLSGQEFALILVDCPEDRVIASAQSILETIRNNTFFTNEGEAFSITASIGLGANLMSDTPSILYRRISSAVYKAKNDGRDRVVHSDEC